MAEEMDVCSRTPVRAPKNALDRAVFIKHGQGGIYKTHSVPVLGPVLVFSLKQCNS